MSNALPAARSRAGLFSASLAEAMWLAILLALPLVMNVSVARSFEASKLLAVVPLAALCLAALLAGAGERLYGGPLSAALLRSAPVRAFAALILIAAIATAASETRWIAFYGDYFRREGLVSWLIYAVLFAAPLLLLRQRAQLERLLDVLLLATVIPCIYAVMQRYNFDFFVTQGLLVGTSAARPGGTLGNPTFLASLLLLVIPLTAARVLSEPAWARRAPWLVLLALQLFTVLLTQSRGPLLGLALAGFVFICTLGAWFRRRRLIFAAFALALALLLGLALLNLLPALAEAASGTPLRRFVLIGGDLTVSSRIGIWQAGVDAFLQAPWWRQMLGHGPDAASFSYFSSMPAAVQRTEGYTDTIDRLHSEFLETLMTFGVAGLAAQVALYSALVWTAAQRLLPAPLARPRAWLGYAAFCLAAMAAGAALAQLVGGTGGGRGIAPIGAGAGLAAAWVLLLAWRGWRYVRSAPAAAAALPARDDGLLIAALVSALIGSWLEAQVGVPTIVNRAVLAVYAALLVLAAQQAWRIPAAAPAAPAPAAPLVPAAAAPAAAGRRAKKQRAGAARQAAASRPDRSEWYPIAGWVTSLGLILAVADFFPPLSGTRILPPASARLPLIIWPLLLYALAGITLWAIEARRSSAAPLQALTRFLLWSVPPALLFVILHFLIGDAIKDAADADLGARVAALTSFAGAVCVLLALALAVALYRAQARAGITRRSGAPALALLVAGAALGLVALLAARADYNADVRIKLSAWADGQGRPDASLAFAREAAALVPGERRYTSTVGRRLVEAAIGQLGAVATNPATGTAMVAQLKEAERYMILARTQAPGDPWTTFAYANVQQFLAARVLAPYLPAPERIERTAAARDAFALAHRQFPGHPWFLRNWAQHEMEQGNRDGALAKLAEMERLDPLSMSVYQEWAKFAYVDPVTRAAALAALRRGLGAFPAGSSEAAALLAAQVEIPRNIGQFGEALSAALEYTAVQPEHVRAWLYLAEMYERNGRRDLAISNAQKALAHFAGRKLDAAQAADRTALETLAQRLRELPPGPPVSAAGR